MMQDVHQLRCTGCARVIALDALKENLRCPECGDLYEVEYPAWSVQSAADSATRPVKRNLPNPSALRWLWKERRTSTELKDQSGVWRFRDLLPILADESNIISLREGNTPLYELPRCAQATGVERLYAKHQGMNPTGSFKDAGMTAALSVAHERGFEWVACASTGNTSAAMAAYAARAGMRSLVLIPEGKIAWGKLSQALDYGALTCQLRTDFDGCVRVLSEVVRRAPVYLLNSVNPYRIEGQKTPALEIAEQLDWQVPDHLIVPGGNLANSSALGKAFLEMKHLGLTDRVPRVSIVQAEGANPLYRSMQANGGRELTAVEAHTRASAIRIGNPASWRKAVKVVEATGGWVEQATEAEIALAKAEIGAEGIGCEPASAVTLVGLKKLLAAGRIDPSESVVLLLTGHTLKDSDYTIQYHRGDLLREEELAPLRPEIEITRRNTVELDADPDQVLRALEKAGRQ
ncbi:threonine synthase [Silvibacterium bohemicum]|uniref:Threonine synthase n=2 Tax=Silvibacterium bohemicum TaxID=1577686 RepID=A0A841K0E7_9BACT|nr:threonine synthase [Silvibacterium bohemicum]MBB6146077.1 threonine synthase [Silvibacterium bohemicum]